MVQDPWLTADFIWKISGFTVILLIISWIFDHFKTDSRLTRRTVLSTGVVVLGYLFFRFLTVPNIEFNETAISILFLTSWIPISFLIYKAVKPDMQKLLKGIFSALISFGISTSFFNLLTPFKNLSADRQIVNSEYALWVPVIIWIILSGLFYAAFNSGMNRFLRLILGMVCGLAFTAILQPPLLQFLNG